MRILLLILLFLVPAFSLAQYDVRATWDAVSDVAGYNVTYTQNGETKRLQILNGQATEVIVPFTAAGTSEIMWVCFCDIGGQYWPCKFYDIKTFEIVDLSPQLTDSIKTLEQLSFGVQPIPECTEPDCEVVNGQ